MVPHHNQTKAHIYDLRYVLVSKINFHCILMFHVSQSEYAQRTVLTVNYYRQHFNAAVLLSVYLQELTTDVKSRTSLDFAGCRDFSRS